MTTTELTFDQRLRLLTRKHRRMQAGVVKRVGRDGLMTVLPRRAVTTFPLHALLLVLLVAFLFKVFLFAWHGADGYGQRIAALQAGTLPEQGMAWVLQPDPVTTMLAPYMASIWR